MKQVSRTALVPFSAEQMYHLVNDVESYPQFLSGCVDAKILEQSDVLMVASVYVAKAGIKKAFTTCNTLVKNSMIRLELLDGPFSSLVGEWQFIPVDEDTCQIEFNLEFEFSNLMIELAFGKIFSDLTSNMVSAFTQRAKQVYSL